MSESNKVEGSANGRTQNSPQPYSIGFTGAWGITAAFIVLLGTLGAASWTTNQATRASEWVTHTYEVSQNLQKALSVLQDAETGQRGYLLTGSDAYLEPFVVASNRINEVVAQLRTLTGDNPRQQEMIGRLEPLIADKLDELKQTISLRQDESADAALAIVRSDRGRLIMDQIREIIAEMESEEAELLVVRQRDLKRAAALSIYGEVIGIILLIGIAVVVISRISRALTLRRNAEMALAESEERVTAIVDKIFDGIVTIDDAGIIQWMNTAATRIFDYGPEELIGQNVKILSPEPYQSAHDTYIRNYLETGHAKIIGVGREVEGKRRDGSIFPMELEIAELRLGNERLFVGVTRDITERKRLDRMKTEFISTVSHELRTPLTSIKGSLGLVTDGSLGTLPEGIKDMVSVAYRNTERLINLVNDILDIEKLDSGGMEFDFELLDLSKLVHEAIEANKGLASEFSVQFAAADPISKVMVKGDSSRLVQVFVNLLSNAAKFSNQGGSVEISVAGNNGMAKVSVSDHGSGIPAEFRERIFERFSQADGSDSRGRGGTGLGLSIAKSIIEDHGGSIGFDTEEGAGSSFYFTLPISE